MMAGMGHEGDLFSILIPYAYVLARAILPLEKFRWSNSQK